MTEALDQAERATDELRELAHGILPAVLTHGGLRAGGAGARVADAGAGRERRLRGSAPRRGRGDRVLRRRRGAHQRRRSTLAPDARRSRAGVEDGTLRVQVRDDGVGGARPDGSGLLGLGDRLAALDGRLWVESPVDGGTIIAADIPLPGESARVPRVTRHG